MNAPPSRTGRNGQRESLSMVRLQPSLLDRLTDDEPHNSVESNDKRVLNKSQLRQCVLRDLAWLLNTSNTESDLSLEHYPQVLRSVVNFGMRSFSGMRLSEIELPELERNVRRAILDFEPRILPSTLEIKALSTEDLTHHHNMMAFEIRCQMWAQPYPLSMLLRTNLDLESGEMVVQDHSGAG
ncbi:MAG: type VI secretion system baseplate subunit TssE [Burkholderiaceae bacterium]|nr:type VI secretion system baseplate subunit TssE [Burkholderiaceae bacterium]